MKTESTIVNNALHVATAVLLALLSSNAAAQQVETIVDEARQACASFEDGEFYAEDDAIQSHDLDADGVADQLVDEARFACSSSASLFTPNGGSTLHVIVDGTLHSWQALGWRLIDWGDDRVLLLARHGSHCGGYGYQHCYEAIVFSEGKAMSVAASETPSTEE